MKTRSASHSMNAQELSSRPLLAAPVPAPDVLDDEIVALLDALPDALQVAPDAAPEAPGALSLRTRLLRRVTRSAHASRAFVTLRHAQMPVATLAEGVSIRTLYLSPSSMPRPGEPRRALLVELQPGAQWRQEPGAEASRREWLVVRGEVEVDAQRLTARDFHITPAGVPPALLRSASGALVYLREPATADGDEAEQAYTQLDATEHWHEFGPGIKRRVLWNQGNEAAMLYHVLPGAGVPRHGHGHDEECLMLEGELFLGDVLLRRDDYQLAPAGTVHDGVFTDTGALIYAHGDLDLAVLAS
jgi:quercetin dioxygenase-like cupin family protein